MRTPFVKREVLFKRTSCPGGGWPMHTTHDNSTLPGGQLELLPGPSIATRHFERLRGNCHLFRKPSGNFGPPRGQRPLASAFWSLGTTRDSMTNRAGGAHVRGLRMRPTIPTIERICMRSTGRHRRLPFDLRYLAEAPPRYTLQGRRVSPPGIEVLTRDHRTC